MVGWKHQVRFEQMETVDDEWLNWLMKLRKNHTFGTVRHRWAWLMDSDREISM